MQELRSIILKEIPDISMYEDEDVYYDMYYQFVMKYQLIFFPNNTIIFWGFSVKLAQNEYDLLKSIVKLQSSQNSIDGYTEEQIVRPINYHRVTRIKTRENLFRDLL